MKKTNKTFKRFAAITSASLLAACAVAPVAFNAFAATNVTITNSSADKEVHTYTAYQIFTGTYSTNGLTVEEWASDIDTAKLFESDAWKNFVVVDKVDADPDNGVEAVAEIKIGETQDAAAVAQLFEKIQSNSSKADALADIIYANIKSGATGKDLSAADLSLSAGYYLIKDSYESTDSDGTKQDAMSKYILKVTDGSNLEITTKKSYPTVEKKVKENQSANYASSTATHEKTDKSWNDVADYSIGDAVPFKLYGTLPSTLDDYTNGYKFVFHDSISENLTLIDGDGNGKVDVTVAINGNTVSSDYTVENDADGHGFTVTFDNIKNISYAQANAVVTVEYKATLNSNAVIGQPGQTNEVYLEYSNNPEWKSDGDDTTDDNTTDKTTVDKVVVFTYELDVTKVDGATGVTLANAKFNLSREREVTIDGVASKITEYVQVDANGKVTGWTETAPEDGVLTSDANGLFKVIGLDEGTYKLHETKAPTAEYNLLTEPIIVEINATTSNTQGEDADGTELTAFSYTVGGKTVYQGLNASGEKIEGNNEEQGLYKDIDAKAKATVANNKGTQLPGTGGIGTTIFYLGGGAMAAIGGIYLISKRRMKKSEE